ncbi:MAG: hypothetical protein IPL46_26065 [Saprospiraceae bacterium]|nr:hypothetical protein [Saprospiraceae bacterium]
MITFLHTAKANVKRFEDLVRKYDEDVEIRHFVNEDLLRYALAQGTADSESFQQETAKIKNETSEMIVCTCSSYGDECEKVDGIERIDQPAVEYLVKKYNRIGLAFTVKSTVLVSKKLVEDTARRLNKDVEISLIDCSDCWRFFEQGDPEQYEKEIAQIILEKNSGVEAIFLAQASMQNAAQHLKTLDKEVMASPEYGVQEFLKRLKN